MSTSQKPMALILADKYEVQGFLGDHRFAKDEWCSQAAVELRRLHARITDLEAQLSAIVGDGVESLSELVQMPNAEYLADEHAAVRHLRAIAAQAKQGEVQHDRRR